MSNDIRITQRVVSDRSYYEGETVHKGESLTEVANRSGISAQSSDGKANVQSAPQKSESKSKVKLSELSLSGQIQQMKMKDLEAANKVQDSKNQVSDSSAVDPKDLENKNVHDPADAMFGINPRRILKRLGYPLNKEGLAKAAKKGDADAIELFIEADRELAKKFLENAAQKKDIKAIKLFIKVDPGLAREIYETVSKKQDNKAIKAFDDAGIESITSGSSFPILDLELGPRGWRPKC